MEAVDDTLLAAYLIEPGRTEYDLTDLAAEYGIALDPSPPAEEETESLVRRAALPLRLAPLMRARLAERDLISLYENVELPLTGVLARMEDAGVKIDTYRMGEITARLRERVEELEGRAYELAGEEFMLGSTQQVARVLFEQLGLTPGRKGKTGYSTDTRVLQTIRDEHEIVPVIEEWRELTKLVNTYLGPLPELLGEDGRLHTTFNQAVAATGRLSTSNPNLQSIPIRTELGREIRSAFVAEEGSKLLSADYSQIELRILAHVSGEPKLRAAFAAGEDIHAATAAEVLGTEPSALTKDERAIAKMINFGIVYGISAHGLSQNLQIPRDEAQTYIDTYLARFPHVQDFIARTIEQATVDGYVTSLLGRRRPVPEIRTSSRQTRALGERLAVNFVMQGSNADIIKVAMIGIDRRLRDEGRSARLVLQVHDELLLEVPEAEVRDVRRSSRTRCAAPTISTRRSPSTWARARTGRRPRTDGFGLARFGQVKLNRAKPQARRDLMLSRRKALLAIALVVTVLGGAGVARGTPTDVFFSEYIEGSSNNKALEIYNGTGGTVNLAAGGYTVQMFFNGSASAGLTIALTGTALATGDVYVLAQATASPIILAQADQTNGAGWFNGNDAVVLRKGVAARSSTSSARSASTRAPSGALASRARRTTRCGAKARSRRGTRTAATRSIRRLSGTASRKTHSATSARTRSATLLSTSPAGHD